VRLPRDISGLELVKRLRRYGYEPTRQTGSHIRLTTQQGGEHHVTVPAHDPLRLGTLSSVLAEVAAHLGLPKADLQRDLFE
jgi:predicted RNA binding protein YcfA (HicA-like mRNA interferase family)